MINCSTMRATTKHSRVARRRVNTINGGAGLRHPLWERCGQRYAERRCERRHTLHGGDNDDTLDGGLGDDTLNGDRGMTR